MQFKDVTIKIPEGLLSITGNIHHPKLDITHVYIKTSPRSKETRPVSEEVFCNISSSSIIRCKLRDKLKRIVGSSAIMN